MDCLASAGVVSVKVMLSHHGDKAIQGELHWGWDEGGPSLGSAPLVVQPFRLSEAVALEVTLPTGYTTSKLHLWFVDQHATRLAYNFLDVATKSYLKNNDGG
jgi:hypothetical protein